MLRCTDGDTESNNLVLKQEEVGLQCSYVIK